MSLLGFLFGRRKPQIIGSILSDRTDHYNFYYGFAPGDYRQINVRYETADGKPVSDAPIIGLYGERRKKFGRWWVAYVGGEPVGRYDSKDAAEAGAVAYIEANPEPMEDEP